MKCTCDGEYYTERHCDHCRAQARKLLWELSRNRDYEPCVDAPAWKRFANYDDVCEEANKEADDRLEY